MLGVVNRVGRIIAYGKHVSGNDSVYLFGEGKEEIRCENPVVRA
jgi:hypothetical protein